MQKDSIKREQSQAGLSFAEREKFRPQVKNKLLLLLALLMTAATGAWAQGPVDGTIVWPIGDEGSATVSASIKDAISSTSVTTGSGLTVGSSIYFDTNMVKYTPTTANAGNVEGVMIEYRIEAVDGYKFKPTGVDYAAVKVGNDNLSYSWSYTIDGVESAITDVSYTSVLRSNGGNSGTAQLMHSESITADGCSVFTLRFYISNCGTTKNICIGNITISGSVSAAPATYTVSMKDGVKDADKWTVKVGEGQAQALPIGGLKGDGSETVTLQYNGRLKVKGVKATSDAAPAAPATVDLDASTKAWADGSAFAVPAGGLTYSDAITVSGDVTLTLTEGTTLTLNKGISLAAGATLTVEGNGTMVVNGTSGSTASTVAGSGTLVLMSGTLTATGGNGGSVGQFTDDSHGGNGGDAINGSVIVSGGTLTARGGNGGSVGDYCENCSGGNGGDAISGTLTINGGSTSVNDGSNGSIGNLCGDCTAGTGGKAVTGNVTDNRN